jgi:hypothetical protein
MSKVFPCDASTNYHVVSEALSFVKGPHFSIDEKARLDMLRYAHGDDALGSI